MNKTIRSIALSTALLATGAVFSGCTANNSPEPTKTHKVAKVGFETIDYAKALELHQSNAAVFLDARGYKLYQKSTIMGAVFMASNGYDKLKKFLPEKNTPVVTFCNGFSCEKSDELAEKLLKDGFTNVMVYKGGEPEWAEKKQPLMGIKKECKTQTASSFKPEIDPIEVAGTEVYLLPEDGEANYDGLIDQYWFHEHILNDTMPEGIQIVDVRKAERYAVEHIKGAINVPFEDNKVDTSKLPEDKVIVFYCNTGLKSTDARMSIMDEELLERVFIFDATYKCDADTHKNCVLTPNEPL